MNYVNIIEILAFISGIMSILLIIITMLFTEYIYPKGYVVSCIAYVMITFCATGHISLAIRENNIPGLIYTSMLSGFSIPMTYAFIILGNKEVKL